MCEVFQKLMFINLQARNATRNCRLRSNFLLFIIIHCSFTFYVATISSLNSWEAPEIIDEIFTYFSCEASGIQPGRTCEYVNLESYAIPYVWISNITAMNALYVVNILNIKTRVKTIIVTKVCLKLT